ncbi:MAG TPA: amidase [Gemmatimonadaceae bacterium]|nr:amidase [Gemmatimonadaceae bacterium]
MRHDENEVTGPVQRIGRRAFLRESAAASALAIAAPILPACERSARSAAAETAPAARGSSPASLNVAPFELEEATLAELQAGMQSGKYTSRGLVEAYLQRIASLDDRLHHLLDANPDALQLAEALDAERKAKGARGPLHGIPVLIKGNIDTHDRVTTTAGSYALAGSIAPRDAFVASRLRQAGAVLLGKTNLSEWANFRSTHSSSGWSGRGGQGRNPYALDRTPCGSSSGSAAGVAASYCAVAVGTETDGSVVCPSSSNSIVGIKPTLGLVSRAGIIPIAHSQDTAGPMARTVTDAAILLGALAGVDPRDPATASSRGKGHSDYTRFLDANGLRGARIGVARGHLFGYSDEADALVDDAIALMKDRGAVIIDPANIPTLGSFGDSELEVLLYEFKADLNTYLAGLGAAAPVHSLKEIIAYNEQHHDQEMRYFGQELMLQAQQKGPLSTPAYRKALAHDHQRSRADGLDAVMHAHHLDAIVAPTGAPPWTIDLVNGDHDLGGSSTIAAVAGYPHITVPAGYAFGLPVGISFIGLAYTEPTLLKLAYAFEHATRHRRPPRFLSGAVLTPDSTSGQS